jgi:hypothetical protein
MHAGVALLLKAIRQHDTKNNPFTWCSKHTLSSKKSQFSFLLPQSDSKSLAKEFLPEPYGRPTCDILVTTGAYKTLQYAIQDDHLQDSFQDVSSSEIPPGIPQDESSIMDND